jgi:Domain of unknown function (DUF4388)
MSQVTKRTRVRRLADSVWPGRAVDGYANLIAARLRKLAAAESTGMLPVSGRGDGAIFFRGGQVVYAESSRTPSPDKRTVGLAALGLVPTDDGREATLGPPRGGGAQLVALPSLGRLTSMLALTEPTIDALTELLSSESRYAKFRQSELPPVAQMGPITVETVLAEVERRRQVLRQLAPIVAADTPIVRDASAVESPSFQVSAPQWALLVRVGDGSTPRTLALSLGQSVFGTTIEIYRLLALGLLAVPGSPPGFGDRSDGLGPWGGRRPGAVMSFMRAVADAGGGDERGTDA